MHRKPDNQYDNALHGALSPVTPGVDVKNVMRQIEQFVRPRQDDEGEKTDILTPQYQLRSYKVCHVMRVAPLSAQSRQPAVYLVHTSYIKMP